MASSSYNDILQLLLSGDYSEASRRLSSSRNGSKAENSNITRLRVLLSARLAIKAGNERSALESLEFFESGQVFEKAEAEFVRGLARYSLGDFAEGQGHFREAAKLYSIDESWKRKELLSLYNALSGKWNLSYQESLTEEDLIQLNRLIAKARECEDERMIGILTRQRSAVFQQLDRLHAALDDAHQSALLLESCESLTDYFLAVAQAADVCLDLDLKNEAKAQLERICKLPESRVDFVWSFLQHKIDGKLSEFNPNDFEVRPPLWIYKFERQTVAQSTVTPANFEWRPQENKVVFADGREVRIKAGGLEGTLLSILSRGPVDKHTLCESLWPEACRTENLNDRFHRLISRLNKKLNVIEYDGASYRLVG